jgi:hypothetical protein
VSTSCYPRLWHLLTLWMLRYSASLKKRESLWARPKVSCVYRTCRNFEFDMLYSDRRHESPSREGQSNAYRT